MLLSIADKLDLNDKDIETLKELKELQAKVEEIKASKEVRVKENAKRILDKLKSCDPKGLKSLLKEYGEGC